MTIATQKLKLIELIKKTDDKIAIAFALEIFNVAPKSWDDMPEDEKAQIEKA